MDEIENGDKPHARGELQSAHSVDRLNGKNYLKCSQLIKTILRGKDKASRLHDEPRVTNDPAFRTWDEEDPMIMAWLWNSMISEIRDT